MSYDFPVQSALSLLMAVAILTTVTAMGAFYVLLVQIELQATLRFDDEDDVELEENDPNESSEQEDNYVNASGVARASNKEFQAKNGSNKPMDAVEGGGDDSEEEGVARRLYLPNYRRAALAAIVIIITFMIYLLLALSNANIVLSWIGMAVVVALLLRQAIFEEVRRERLDRLAALFSLLLILAMCMNLVVYSHNQHAQGDIYEGKARIVGYDYSSYSQDKEKDTILRTDLEVAWGHDWGCPNDPNQDCQAFVNGALCETKEDNGGRQRMLQKQQNSNPIMMSRKNMSRRRLDEADVEEEDEVVEEEVAEEEDQADANEPDDESYEDLEAENEELEEENQELEEENEELEEELEEYEDYVDEEDEVIDELDEEIEEEYSFEDDYYYDEYWTEQTWDDVWGEYACEDLFEYDVEGESYDETQPPGNDEWPFINVYGNCNTCEAFIVDYYSTQHFQSILNYKSAGLMYGIMAGFSLTVTAYLTIKESKKNKTTEKEIELLSSSEATAGAMT
mmetsp:Transcript_7557/g.20959  ORF Transcript_7557/g.20959 Transcript_7557/m.20959 type:complete len:510 (-) Transcript_7557:46-1575(-)